MKKNSLALPLLFSIIFLFAAQSVNAANKFTTKMENLAEKLTATTMLAKTAAKTANRADIITVSDVDLKSVFRRLDSAGFKPGQFNEDNLSQLSEAIKRFQKTAKIEESGVLDSGTWDKMQKLYDPMSSGSNLERTQAQKNNITTKKDASLSPPQTKAIEKIALLNFKHPKTMGTFAKQVFGSLSTALINKGFKVPEQTLVDQAMSTNNISVEGVNDIATAQKLGQSLASEAAIMGDISEMDDSIIIRAKLVDTAKGEALSASEVSISKKAPEVAKLIGKNKLKNSSVGDPLIKETPEFIFKIKKCQLLDTTLTCHITITSKGEDRLFGLFYDSSGCTSNPSRVFDDSGIEYRPEYVFLAGKEGYSPYNSLRSMLISGVPTKTSLTFENVKSKPKSITRFDLVCQKSEKHGCKNIFRIEFRNIPIKY